MLDKKHLEKIIYLLSYEGRIKHAPIMISSKLKEKEIQYLLTTKVINTLEPEKKNKYLICIDPALDDNIIYEILKFLQMVITEWDAKFYLILPNRMNTEWFYKYCRLYEVRLFIMFIEEPWIVDEDSLTVILEKRFDHNTPELNFFWWNFQQDIAWEGDGYAFP